MSYEGVYGRGDMLRDARAVNTQMGVGGGIGFARTAQPYAPVPRSINEPPVSKVADLKELDQPSRKVDPSLLASKAAKLRVKIWVTDTSNATMTQLKTLGVEVIGVLQPGKLINATVDPSKLLALAKLGVVQYIAPLISSRPTAP